jgi:hypothetical protein
MTDYRELAAAELAKIVRDNGAMRGRAREAREDRLAAAAEMEAVAMETSFRLAEDYIALASLERDAPPPVTPDPGQE